MNALRLLSLFAISLTLVLASFGLASAASLTVSQISAPSSVANNAGTFDVTFNVSNTGTDTNASLSYAITNGIATTIAFTPTSPVTILMNQSAIITAKVSFAQQSGPIAGTITIDPSGGGGSKNFTFSVPLVAVSPIILTKTQDLKSNQNGTFTVTNNGQFNLGTISFSVNPAGSVSFNPLTLSSLPAASTSAPISISIVDFSKLVFGSNTVTVTATSGPNVATVDFPVKKTFCTAGPVGANLSIGSVTVRNTGDEDETWNPLDQITVSVDVDNNGLADMKEVYVKIGLFDSAGSNKIKNVDFTSSDDEEASIGTINDGGTEKARFEFDIPADLKEGTYRLAIKAYSKRSGETKDCADSSSDFDQSTYQTISVEKRSKQGELIAVSNFNVPEQNICGATLSGSFEIANVGDTDQDQVLVRMRSTELNLDQQFETRENLDTGDFRTFNFDIPVPSTLKDGSYHVFLRSQYDYRNGVYHESSKDETEEVIKVIGCSGTGSGSTGQNAAITATLGSDAKAGEKLVVNAVVRNLASTSQTFVLDATGYQSWATLDSMSDRVVTLGAGESKSVTIVLAVNKDAQGAKGFTFQATTNGKTNSQDVEVNLASATSSGFSLAGNGLLWVIGAINLVLIILIIVVAVRVSRR